MNSFSQIEDGAWCWFQDPRAHRHVGAYDKIYWGCVTKTGDIKISSYDCNNHKRDTFTLHPALDINDHAAPAILIRHDSRIVVFYSKHNANTMYWRVSTNPEDITSFGDEMSFTGDDLQICYPNPVQLTGEDNKIYLYYRKRTRESPTLERESCKASTNGENFGPEQDIIDVGNRTYVKVISNGIDKIHFCVTKSDNAAGIHKHIYYCYYSHGSYYKADGTKISAALPLGESNLEKVYDSDAAGHYQAWIWDIALDSDGNPCIVFATFVSDTDHRYNYTRWTGSTWEVHEMTSAGGCLYPTEPHYSGGISLDKEDPSIVYLSKLVSSQWEIQKIKTIDVGKSWETPVSMTYDSPKKNIRPVAVRNGSSRFPVFWMYGDYTTYTDYVTTLSTKDTEDGMSEIKPSKIRIEASSVCQLSCPSCPNTSKSMNLVVGSGFLKFKDFQKLVDENPWVKGIELSNYGEIFLNPELLEIIEYACKREVSLQADSGVNMNNVQEDVLEGLVKYRLRSMTCSIDGASNDTYKIYRVKGNFETVIENIRKINFFKQKYQSEYPRLTWQFIVFGHNEHEIPLARTLAGELGMNFSLKLTWDDKFSPIRDPEYVRKLVGTASRAEYKQKYGIEYGQGFCHQLWDEPQINWNGKVLGCCRNFWGDFGGNAFRDGLLKSINSEKIKYARDMLLGKKIAREDIPCTTCSIYLHNKEEGKWLRRPLLNVSNSLSVSVKEESKRTEYEETIEHYKNLDISISGIPKNQVPRQANANMSDAELVAFYSEQYVDVDVAEFLMKERKERLYGLCNLVKQGEFYLDVGCANGGHMEILHQRGINGIGLDLSIPNILRGRQKYPYLKFIHGFAETIPFKDNHFDIVILGDVIEHFRNPKVNLSECLRVAGKGLALCVPIKPEVTAEHINPFSCDEIVNLLEFFKLRVHFYDGEGRKISKTEAESKLEAFSWLLMRAEKTEQTNSVVKGITDTEGAKGHRQAVDQILSNDEWRQNTEHQRDETHLNRFKFLSHLIEGQKVLEVGCGNGDLSVGIARLGFDVVGVDISKSGIQQAVELAKKENLDTKARFKVMDAASLEFADNSFDTVFITEVLEHVRDSRRLIKEAIRVTRNGGRILISVPDGLLIPYQGHLRVFLKDTLTTELSQYTSGIRWHEIPFKKWLVCSFFVRKEELNITEGPTVDILMPTYNGRKYIKNAIKSVLDQTYQNWNLIVVNDGGEDVKDIIDEFYDDRIKYFVTEHKGKGHALNIGIANSNEKFVCYMDDDDILYPIHLEILVKAALEWKKGFVYSDWYIVSLDENDREVARKFEFRQDVAPWMLIRQNYISNSNFLHARSLLVKAGMYDEELDIIIDWDMIRRLAFVSEPYHVWGVTNEHMLYYNKGILKNRITGLLTRSPDKVRRSMERITNKTMNLPATTKELKKAVIDAMLHQSYYHSLELNNALQAKDTQISNLEAAIKDKDIQLSNLVGTIRDRDDQISRLEGVVRGKEAQIFYLEVVVRDKEAMLNHIYNSHGWKALSIYYGLRNMLFPANSKRRIIGKIVFNALLKPMIVFNALLKPNDLLRNLAFQNHIQPLVSIIVPVHNQWRYTYACLESILENTDEVSYEVIIADDQSTDDTLKMLSKISGVQKIRNPENMGFLKNCNHAVEYARGKYILFLNNDTKVQKEWLKNLVKIAENDEQAGIVGGKLLFPDGRLQEAGSFMDKDGWGRPYGCFDAPEYYEYNYVKEVDCITGACLLIRKELFLKIGGFDEKYIPAFYEEFDLEFAVREAGYKIIYQPKSIIVHHSSSSYTSTIRDSLSAVHHGTFMQKWASRINGDIESEDIFLRRDRSKNKKIVLFFDEKIPDYDKHAGSLSTYQYIRLFQEMGFKVIFIPDSLEPLEPYTTELQQSGVEVVYGPFKFDRWIEQNGKFIDYVWLSRPNVAIKYVKSIRYHTKAKILYYTVDLHFLRKLRQYEIDKRKENLDESNRLKGIEFYLFENVDVILTPSDQEQKIIRESFPEKHVFAVPIIYNDVSITNEQILTRFDKRHDLIFLGGFDHQPNVDAIQWFCSEIYPLIKQEIPDIKFWIVGSNPPHEITTLTNHDIIVTGHIKDLKPLFDRCRVFVCPLRYGAGIKGKIITSMSHGVPVITTDIGNEGLNLKHGVEAFIANDPTEFANQTIRLYTDPDIWIDASRKSLLFVKNNFSKAKANKMLLNILGIIRRKCSVCGEQIVFSLTDKIENLRETIFCQNCGALKRNIDLADSILKVYEIPSSSSLNEAIGKFKNILLYEFGNTGPIHGVFSNLSNFIYSEYFDNVKPGNHSPSGVRCEDIQAITFRNNMFDLIISQDVFEHVPNPEKGFKEIFRVLKPGGFHIFTVPFKKNISNSVTRAVMKSGRVKHLLDPTYHRDPIRPEGGLVFTDFGKDLVNLLESVGFEVEICEEDIQNYKGGYNAVFIAKKGIKDKV